MLKIDGIAPIIYNDGKDGRVHSLTLKSIFVISVQHLVSSLLQSPLPSPSPESQATQATLCQNLLSFSQSLDVLFSNHSPVVNTGQYTLYLDQYMWETRVKTTLLNLTTPNPRVNIQTKLLIGFGVSQWQQLSSSVKWDLFHSGKRKRKKANNKKQNAQTTTFSDKKSQRRTGFFTGDPSGGGLGASLWCYKSLSGN